MFTKLLVTAVVAALAYLVVRNRNRQARLAGSRQPALPRNRPPPPPPAPGLSPRYLAYGLLVMMLAGSGLFLFLQWQDNYRVVTVRVVNTNTGDAVRFKARRGDVQDRSFETLDGRRVVLAAVERLEMGGD